jgi:two-component system, NarL family, invasion response regulator UvrY
MISVLIVDDHAVVRRGLKQALADEIRDIAFGEAADAKQALAAVAKRPWDLLILDLTLPDRDGLEVLGEVCRQHPKTKVMVLSVNADCGYANRAMQLGARGYVAKDAPLAELLSGVRHVLAGKKYVCRLIAKKLAENPPTGRTDGRPLHASLSPREREILLALSQGKTVGEIAADHRLDISTVSTYKRRVLNKLQLNSTAEIVRYVIDHGLKPWPNRETAAEHYDDFNTGKPGLPT